MWRKVLTEYWELGIQNVLSYHGFSNNIKSNAILKLPTGVLGYDFQKDLVLWNAIQII